MFITRDTGQCPTLSFEMAVEFNNIAEFLVFIPAYRNKPIKVQILCSSLITRIFQHSVLLSFLITNTSEDEISAFIYLKVRINPTKPEYPVFKTSDLSVLRSLFELCVSKTWT